MLVTTNDIAPAAKPMGIDRLAVLRSARTFQPHELRWLVDAQNAQIWTASALIGIEPTSAHIGGDARQA